MQDIGHLYTEKQLKRIEKEIIRTFQVAIIETDQKASDFVQAFLSSDKEKRLELSQGKITDQQYKQWVTGQIFQKDRYDQFIKDYTKILDNYDRQALLLINDSLPDIFMENANYIAYEIENGLKLNIGFNLWDKNTVALLIAQDKNLLPTRVLNIAKNDRWNAKAIRRQITQGILQGESIDKIAKRLQQVTNMNKNNAITNSRTAVTGSQNAGRQARFKEAVGLGLKPKKKWVATIDSKTRDTHIMLDGQTVDYNKKFEVQGQKIRYPADPLATPSLVYNCRCTIISVYDDIEMGALQQERLSSQKYLDWKSKVK